MKFESDVKINGGGQEEVVLIDDDQDTDFDEGDEPRFSIDTDDQVPSKIVEKFEPAKIEVRARPEPE